MTFPKQTAFKIKLNKVQIFHISLHSKWAAELTAVPARSLAFTLWTFYLTVASSHYVVILDSLKKLKAKKKENCKTSLKNNLQNSPLSTLSF